MTFIPLTVVGGLQKSYQKYTATVTGDGDINVECNNDDGLEDVVIDWVLMIKIHG